MQHISDMPRGLSIVSVWGFLVFSFMGSSALTIAYLKLVLYITLFFWHGQCSIWKFLVLAFIKSTNLTFIYFSSNFSWSGNDAIVVCKLYTSIA